MSPRKLLLSLAASSSALLGACTGGGQSLNLAPAGQTYYFRGFATVDIAYISRYACLDRRLMLKCTCTSKLARTCDCRC